MKILTYSSFGSTISTIVITKIKEFKTNIRGNDALINFIKSFDHGEYGITTSDQVAAHPNELFPLTAP